MPIPGCPVPGGECLLCDDDHCRELRDNPPPRVRFAELRSHLNAQGLTPAEPVARDLTEDEGNEPF